MLLTQHELRRNHETISRASNGSKSTNPTLPCVTSKHMVHSDHPLAADVESWDYADRWIRMTEQACMISTLMRLGMTFEEAVWFK